MGSQFENGVVEGSPKRYRMVYTSKYIVRSTSYHVLLYRCTYVCCVATQVPPHLSVTGSVDTRSPKSCRMLCTWYLVLCVIGMLCVATSCVVTDGLDTTKSTPTYLWCFTRHRFYIRSNIQQQLFL